MNENLENRCMSLRDESLQINCSDNGADAVPVTRCKDCKYKGNSVFREDGTEYIVCWNQGYGIQHPCDWYCADGGQK